MLYPLRAYCLEKLMLKVISFGEALVDLLSNNIREQHHHGPETFTKFPGGAPANVAAAVARLGGKAFFAGMLGADMFGDFIANSLAQEGVHLDYLRRTKEAKTGLAFVSLDANCERSFEFYRHPSADMLFKPEDFSKHCFDGAGLFHFCSNTLTTQGLYEATLAGLQRAKKAQWLVSFDVNLRLNLWSDISQAVGNIWQCFEYAQLVKMSLEELDFVANGSSHASAIEKIMATGVQLIMITDGAKPLSYFSVGNSSQITPPEVQMIDATAAGDAFVGGLLYILSKQNLTPSNLGQWLASQTQLEAGMRFASACGAHAVQLEGAISSLPKREDIQL
jgi:fructokinase